VSLVSWSGGDGVIVNRLDKESVAGACNNATGGIDAALTDNRADFELAGGVTKGKGGIDHVDVALDAGNLSTE